MLNIYVDDLQLVSIFKWRPSAVMSSQGSWSQNLTWNISNPCCHCRSHIQQTPAVDSRYFHLGAEPGVIYESASSYVNVVITVISRYNTILT